jgi:hypothetical protein
MVNATLEIWHETFCEIVDEELDPLHIEYSSHTLAISHLLIVILLYEVLAEFVLAIELYPVVLLDVVDERIALAHVADEPQVAHVTPCADVVGEDVLGCLVAPELGHLEFHVHAD